METDPRGQLGGLETSEAVRQRLASESHSYKCSLCGKTNLEILQDCEKAAEVSASTIEEVEIPPDLKMGWKEDMRLPTAAMDHDNGTAGQSALTDDQGVEFAELSDGFFRNSQPAAKGRPSLESQSLPTHTQRAETTSNHTGPTHPHSEPPPPQSERTDGRQFADRAVPSWIDRGIVVLVVLLAAMLLKILLGP
jgi:ubiquitin-conjugating enzyme E2 J1